MKIVYIGWRLLIFFFQIYITTSTVPVEHGTLKSGRDAMGRDDDDGRRWKDRREGWNTYVDEYMLMWSQLPNKITKPLTSLKNRKKYSLSIEVASWSHLDSSLAPQ